MDTEGLSIICAGLGITDEDIDGGVIGYAPSEYCSDNLKDLQRFLRRDDPQRRDVFKQLCKWSTVSRDLIPIVDYCQADRNLVINAVKVLVFLTMPVDPASDDVAQQIEHLWNLKAAMSQNVTVAVIVSLLEDPLDHLERDMFTEDDWKLVQLVLTLFRNILAIQDISMQQKASGCASQILSLRDRFLEIMFEENVMDLILVLTQHVDDPHGYLHQDNLLLLEIFYYIFLGQDPELIAKASIKDSKENGDISISLSSLRSIMEEEAEKRRITGQRNLIRHSQFSGTFTRLTVGGSKTLFKGNPPVASGDCLYNPHKVQRGPQKRTAWDHESFFFPKENTLGLLSNFLIQFLSGGYNVLMQSVREDIEKESHAIQNPDVIIFFRVAHFVIAFQHKVFVLKKTVGDDATSDACFDKKVNDDLFHGDICGPVAATMNEAMFTLVISKWRETFEELKQVHDYKSLSAAGSLVRNMVRMLDLVLKLLPEDSREPQTARILSYKIFYDQTDQGFTQFLFNMFKSFDAHKQPKSDLADLLEIIHLVFRLMEKLQERGTLRVSRKARKGRKKKTPQDINEESQKPTEHPTPQVTDDLTRDCGEPTSESYIDPDKLHREDLADELLVDKNGGILTSNPELEPNMDTQDMGNHSYKMDTTKVDQNTIACEIADSSNDDEAPRMNEVDFNVSKLVASFVSNVVVRNLCWLLKHYKSNSASTNHYIIRMLQRICDDLELSPMLYQLSLLTTFYDILADKKTTTSKEYETIVYFLTKFLRKLLKMIKKQPLLFVEMLFWKTHKECHYINAEAVMHQISNLKKQVQNLNAEGEAVLSKDKEGFVWRSIADSLGDDEADVVITDDRNFQMEENLLDRTHETDLQKPKQGMLERNSKRSVENADNDMEENKSVNYDEEGIPMATHTQMAFRRRKDLAFGLEQVDTIKSLFEKYKDDRRCNHLIAQALDPDGNISPVQIARKLRQLGLKVSRRKLHSPAADDLSGIQRNGFTSDATLHARKRIRAISKEQELEVKVLFEQFKDHKKCSHMIANALDSGNTYTAAQVSRKLRQLGLLVPQRKTCSKVARNPEDGENTKREQQSDEETLGALRERSRKKKRKSSVQEATMTSISHHEGMSNEDDSDNEILSTMLRNGQRSGLKGKEGMLASDSFTTGSGKGLKSRDHEENMRRSVPLHDPSRNVGHEAVGSAVSDDNPAAELNNATNSKQHEITPSCSDEANQQGLQIHDEVMILEDSMDSGEDTEPVVPEKRGLRRNLKMVIDVEDDE